jgi:hypothetical protein
MQLSLACCKLQVSVFFYLEESLLNHTIIFKKIPTCMQLCQKQYLALFTAVLSRAQLETNLSFFLIKMSKFATSMTSMAPYINCVTST